MPRARPKIHSTVTREEWEYELQPGRWIPEDDEASASHKALGKARTGRVRSRTVVVQRSAWAVKQQDLLVRGLS